MISPVISTDSGVAQCYVDNSWWCGQYWSDYRPELIDATVQHLWITVVHGRWFAADFELRSGSSTTDAVSAGVGVCHRRVPDCDS